MNIVRVLLCLVVVSLWINVLTDVLLALKQLRYCLCSHPMEYRTINMMDLQLV